MRILLISSIPAIPTWGSAMTFYRHFCERKDFAISVITDDKQIVKYKPPYSYLLINKGKVWTRISQTRLYLIPHTWNCLVGCWQIPDVVLTYARNYKPDAIFTMAGSWTWMAIMAGKVAKKLNVPLIGSFNDWWYYNIIYHRLAEKMIERKFLHFYNQCDLAICTSEGMQKALGKHLNSMILYPTGAVMKKPLEKIAPKTKKTFTVAFAGNLGEWYGKMLESLVTVAKGSDIRFRIFGSNPGWTNEFNRYVKDEGIYYGQLPFEQLEEQIQQVDGLLLLMGFDPSCAMIEATSFKTKFLDYLSFQKPIMLWGPPYCSAAAIANEFGSAEVCTLPEAEAFLDIINKVKRNPGLQQQLVANAYQMYQQRFHPEKIHTLLTTKIKALKQV